MHRWQIPAYAVFAAIPADKQIVVKKIAQRRGCKGIEQGALRALQVQRPEVYCTLYFWSRKEFVAPVAEQYPPLLVLNRAGNPVCTYRGILDDGFGIHTTLHEQREGAGRPPTYSQPPPCPAQPPAPVVQTKDSNTLRCAFVACCAVGTAGRESHDEKKKNRD